jgi:uncharacterized protein with FMN-binding domain
MASHSTNIFRQKRIERFFNLKAIIQLLAILSLVAAYFIGFSQREKNALVNLQKHYPQGTSFKKVSTNPLLFEVVHSSKNTHHHYAAIEKTHGYGGPLTVGTEVDPSGVVQRVLVIDHKETPAYIKKIQEHQFFEQFIGKKVTAPLKLGKDIDIVTGATVSSTAFSKTVRQGSHAIGTIILNLPIKEEKTKWSFGFKEGILLILYVLVFFGVIKKIGKLRYITLAAGAVFLGFYFNSAISLSNIAVIFLGYFPPVSEKLFWYLLVIGALLIILIYGKNLYCFWLCPFGAIQELTAKIGGINIQLSKKTLVYVQYISYTLTWAALMIIFITANPSLGSYEPFATLFGLEGFGVQWYILPAVILGSFVLNRFWCRFFCPVGVVFRLTTKARLRVKRLLRN